MCANSKAVVEKVPGSEGSQRDADKTPQQKRYPYNWPQGAENVGYLTERQVKARMTTQSEQTLDLADGFKLRWAAVSQRGYVTTEENSYYFQQVLSFCGGQGEPGRLRGACGPLRSR